MTRVCENKDMNAHLDCEEGGERILPGPIHPNAKPTGPQVIKSVIFQGFLESNVIFHIILLLCQVENKGISFKVVVLFCIQSSSIASNQFCNF